MIQVQIASQLTATGVDGVRWVLVDPGEPGSTSTPPPEAAAAAGPAAAGASDEAPQGAPGRSLPLLKLMVVGLGIVLALWLAQALHGPARLPAWFPAEPPVPARGPVPGRAAPPSPAASAVEPGLTTSTMQPDLAA